MSAMENLGFDGENPGPIKVAQITFAYNNSRIISWLQKRGTLIKTEKWDKLDELNEQILTELKSDEKKYDKGQKNLVDLCQTPCSVFATFESEEGVNRARKYNDEPQRAFLKQMIDIQEASEPTDIIWENRHWTEQQRNIKRAIVWTVILIALTISGVCIFFMTKYSLSLKFKYPKTQCSVFDQQYGVNADGTLAESDLANWSSDSVKEWNANIREEGDTREVHFGGIM
jgi:hypothetical protein